MDITKALKDNQVVLALTDSEKYNALIVDVMKKISGRKVCYVTLNKTYDSLKELFTKKKVDLKNTVFIDAISKTFMKEPSQTSGCYYCSSPSAFTEIALSINKFLKHDFEYLIFDSVTNMLIYEKKAPVAKVILDIINKVKASKTKAVFYALQMKEHEELVEETQMFVDNVVHYK
jgi:KaiC/GvpD/RAD55 family RecA-like ATPase